VGASDAAPIDVPNFRFESHLGSGPYLWYKDGAPIDGGTHAYLPFGHIGSAEQGTYHCESFGLREISRSFTIVESGLSANFSADVTNGSAPLTVNFTSLSTGATSWAWDFDGDSVTDSELEHPSFEYEMEGLYTVTLTVSDIMTSTSEVKLNYIDVTEPTDTPPPAMVLGLEQNYPNPFNPSTKISFSIPKAGLVRLSVFDSSGRRVALLSDGPMDAGTHQFTWNAEHEASGVFYYKLEAAGKSFVKKCVLLK
jgi:PKD repeat protein